MPRIRRILVAIKNPVAKSQPAVTKAAQLAQALGAKLDLFHALTESIYIGLPSAMSAATIEREQREACRGQLERIAAKLRAENLTVSVTAEWDYPAHEAVLRRALVIKADLIVAEHHKAKHRLAWFLAFTDWELLRLSPVPVLLVKSPRRYHKAIVLAALDPTHADKPAALDDEILSASAALTAALKGRLHALHAYAPAPDIVASIKTRPELGAELERRIISDAKARFDRVLRLTGIRRSARHLVSGDPVDAIDTISRKIRSAIVVMGTISRSGLQRALIGNTAEQALDRLRCDVLVVKPPRFTAPISRKRSGVRVVTVPLPQP